MVNKNFAIKKILSDEDMKSLWEVYHDSVHEFAHQDYSLHHVWKAQVNSKHMKESPFRTLDAYYAKMGYNPFAKYFLKYVEWSWARPHHDNIGTPTKTAITLLEEQDLEGGETLVWDKHYDLPKPEGAYVKRGGSIHRQDEIVCTPRLQPGESLLYDDNIRHGVAQVRGGHRIVLVTWYRRK